MTADAPMKHKTIRHIHDPGDVHELTFSCYRQMPLLTEHESLRLLAESVDRAVENHHWRLIAFVFMPDHVHLLVCPTESEPDVPALLQAIKWPYSFRMKQRLLAQRSPVIEHLTVQERPGVTRFRFWQEGPGYDRNLSTPAAIHASIDYLHRNPVRRCLCARAVDWKWSSARRYISPDAPADPDLPTIHGLPDPP